MTLLPSPREVLAWRRESIDWAGLRAAATERRPAYAPYSRLRVGRGRPRPPTAGW